MRTYAQPFPKTGVLATNLDLTISQLTRRIGKPNQRAVSYILSSVKLDRSSLHFEQCGSAPNFQGDRLTLCTCKHQMRASRDTSQWEGEWIVGFTGRCIYERRHWLFYIAKIASAHESHAELWNELPDATRYAKSSQEHFLGDLFQPRGDVVGNGRFSPRRYFAPSRHSHRRNKCDSGWHNDINYKYSKRYGRPSLLVGDPEKTFLWDRPVIYYDEHHCRNFLKWDNITELLPHLRC